MKDNGMKDKTENYEKIGYLQKHYKLFYLKDSEQKEFTYHYHDFDKLICFLGGKVDYMIEGKKYELEPYDFLLVNRNEIHKPIVDFTVPYERIILYIEHEFLEQYRKEEYDLTTCFSKTKTEQTNVVRFPAVITKQVCDFLFRMDKCEKEDRYAKELYEEILFLQFMIWFNSACIECEYSYHRTAKYNKKIIEMIQFINENLSKDLTIDQLSEQFFMSKYHMMRRFKEETGYSIHQYISEKRILAARSMIQDGMSATAAALECGFKDYSTFARAFRKCVGKLPSEI